MKTAKQIAEQIMRISAAYNQNTKKMGWSEGRWNAYSRAMDIYDIMLARNGVAESMVFDKQNRPVFFDISRSGQHPFVFDGENRKYLKSSSPVRYFSDSYFTPVSSWTSMAHYRNESGDLVVKPEILNLVIDGCGLRNNEK